MNKNAKYKKIINAKSQKGITLTVLVITIIVMLTLASATINLVIGEGGILEQSQKTKKAQEEKIKKEDTEVDTLIEKAEGEIERVHLLKGRKVFGTNVEWKEKNGDGKEYTAIIPVGFCVVKDVVVNETTGEKDINNIPNGLVISDREDDDLNNSAGGNQFVWIPVEDMSKFVRVEGFYNNTRDTMLANCQEAGKEGEAITTDESIAMYKSVEKNKGFYIARFEAGVNGKTIPITEASAVPAPDGTTKPVSKKGVAVWNFIPWSISKENGSDGLPGKDSENGAVKVARSMYTKSANCGVTSTLCYGVQWDAIMQYIEPNYLWKTGEVDKVAEDSFVRNSDGKGNHSKSITFAGSNLDYQQNHIYGLAGNVYEWTMESHNLSRRIFRGGGFYSGTEIPSSRRLADMEVNCDTDIDTRFSCSTISIKK